MTHTSRAHATGALVRALMALLPLFCWFGIAQAVAQKFDFTVADSPLNTSVQSLLAPVLAMSIGPSGGLPYASAAVGVSAVCVAADGEALIAPITVTTVDGLFYNVSGTDAHLDITHSCYLDTAESPPQCVALLTSTAADCGGIAADAVGPLLNASSPEVAMSSAAVLASYLRDGAAQRLKLERSLRRTREVVRALDHARDLVLSANGTVSDALEMTLVLGKATQYVRAAVSAAYDRVIEKYYVLEAWTNQSLGLTASHRSVVVGPMEQECEVRSYAKRLLWGTEASLTVLLDLVQDTLAIADSIHSKTYTPAIRGVQCTQVLTGLALMALEDDAVRQAAAMVALNTLNASSVWALADFELLAATRTAALRERQLWGLGYVFALLADPAVVDDLVGSAAVAECMRRAALVVPDPTTGTVPPSIYWCLDNAFMGEMTQTAVAQRSLAINETDTAANGQCLWGFSEWDGGCDRAAFDPTRCESCPPGSVGDGEGHCVCGNSTSAYATLTSGCLAKGTPHDVAGIRVAQANGNVSLPANMPVTLLSVQLPHTASLSDPSAYLRVNVACVDGGRGGGTRLLATPNGDRTAACASVVGYERQAERTGERTTFSGTQYFVTYAENLTISVLGSAAFFGETCRVEAEVQSALRQASRSVVAGTWTFIPRAEAFTLTAHSYLGDVPADATAAPSDVPLCSQKRAVVANARDSGSPAVQAGVCRTTSGSSALFVQPSSYSVFGTSTQLTMGQRIRSSAGSSRDASFIETLQSLANRTSFELTVSGAADSDILWSGTWQLSAGTPLAANAWAAGWVVSLKPSVLRGVRSLRLRVADTTSASAFVAYEATAELRYGNETESSGGSSDGKHHGDDSNDGALPTAEVPYNFWYVILIVAVSVLDAFILSAFALLVYLRHSPYTNWPHWCQ